MAQLSEQQKARELRQSKNTDGLLTKLGRGKTGRYGKAAMLTAGLMASGGSIGASASKEQDNINQGKQTTISQSVRSAEQQRTQRFEVAENPEIYTAGSETGASGVNAGDQAAMRRRLEQGKLQDRNSQEEASTQMDQGGEGSSEVKQDKEDGGQGKSLRARWQKVQTERKKIKDIKAKAAGVEGAGTEAATAAANKAIQLAYNQIQSVIEEGLIDVFYLIFILGLPYFILWGARPLIAMIGMGQIKIKKFNVNVRAVPGYTLEELPLRLLMLALIGIIFAIEWFLIVIIIWIITDPADAFWELGLGAVLELFNLIF